MDKLSTEPSNSQTGKAIDYLMEDPIIPGQLWACLSFLSPETLKNCNVRAIKIRGVFSTRKEAEAKAKELSKLDPDFHIFVGEVGKWLPWDPDATSVEDQRYNEPIVQDIMKKYKENQKKGAAAENYRKEQMREKAIEEEAKKLQNKSRRERMKQKINDKKLKKEIENLEVERFGKPGDILSKSDDKIKKQEELIKAETNKLNVNEEKIKKTEKTIETADKNINKLQEIYKKLVLDKEKK